MGIWHGCIGGKGVIAAGSLPMGPDVVEVEETETHSSTPKTLVVVLEEVYNIGYVGVINDQKVPIGVRHI